MNRTIYKASEDFVKNIGDTELQHWKYIKKIPSGKGFRYFYSWDEWRAYLADPAANAATKTGNAAKQQVTNGKNKVESLLKNQNKGSNTVSSVMKVNGSRDPSFRERINNLAKRASEKWKNGGEAVKQSIKNGKKWFDKHLNPVEAYKRKKIERKKKEEFERKAYEEKREELAKKYKYIEKKTINGKVRYFYTKDELDAYNRKQEYVANEPAFMKDVKKSKEPYTREEDAMLVNPKLNSFDSNYSYNCAECTAIYELRRRGYDVESNGESGLGENSDKYNSEKRFKLFYEGAETHHIEPASSDEEFYRNLQREFDQYPPGSRGDISFKWKGYNAAHSIVWEKDMDGNVHFVDTQTSGGGNQVEHDVKGLASCMDHEYTERKRVKGHLLPQEVGYTNITRTDNLELKPEIKKICKDSSDKRPRVNTSYRQYSYSNGQLTRKYDFTDSGTMSEKDAVTKYPNLLENKSYKETRKEK